MVRGVAWGNGKRMSMEDVRLSLAICLTRETQRKDGVVRCDLVSRYCRFVGAR